MSTATITDDERVTLVDLATAAGISYRRADYWVRQGYVHVLAAESPTGHAADYPQAPGSGHIRYVAPYEAHVLHLIARLVRAGLGPEVAARAARALAMHPRIKTVTLAPGVSVSVTELPPQSAVALP